jgi:uncharacterized membrane protein
VTAIRILIAVLSLIGLGLGWHLTLISAWIAAPVAVALVIWGLDLDWRRKKRVADEKVLSKEREIQIEKRRAMQLKNRSELKS